MKCIKLDLKNLKISNVKKTIKHKGQDIFYFKNTTEAKAILNVLRENKIDEYCYLGNIKSPTLSIIKSKGRFPKYSNNKSIDCLNYSNRIKAIKKNDQYVVTDSKSRIQTLKNKKEAEAIVKYLHSNKLQTQCFCKRPKPGLRFWTKKLATPPLEPDVVNNKWQKFRIVHGKSKTDELWAENINGTLYLDGDIVVGENGKFLRSKAPKRRKVYNKKLSIKAKYAASSKTGSVKFSNSGAGKYSAVAANNSRYDGTSSNARDALLNTYIWPFGHVPYSLNSNLNTSQKSTVRKAIKDLNDKTEIYLYERKNKEQDYIDIKYDKDLPSSVGGSSSVGRQGGKQTLRVNKNVSQSTVVHELMHAIGFYHEQSRPDRNKYAIYNQENVSHPDREKNFKIHKNAIVLTDEYDFDSIMHYDGCSFSKDKVACRNSDHNSPKFATLTKKDGSKIIRKNRLSPLDILGVNTLYKREISGRPNPLPSDQYREVTITIDKVKLVKGSKGFFDFKEDFTCEMVMGKGSGWRYNKPPKAKYYKEWFSILNLPAQKVFNNKKNYKKPKSTNNNKWKWNVSIIIPPGERYAQSYFRIWEEGNFLPWENAEQVDCNPVQNLSGLYLIYDTFTDEIYLTNKQKKKTICVGYIGEKLNHIQGYQGTSAGYVLNTSIKAIPKSKINPSKPSS